VICLIGGLVPSVAAAAAPFVRVLGGEGGDRIRGSARADLLMLRGGNDRADGGGGSDRILGGAGADRIRGGAGSDTLLGEGGNDVIDARDGHRDALVDGGPGRDTCYVDHADRVRNCEGTILARSPTPVVPLGSLEAPLPGSGAPAGVIGPGVRAPASHALGLWTPTRYDTCPTWLHDTYAVVGPDGRRYPTWHPPSVVNPETGRGCTFGHEHGRDPRASRVLGLIARQLRGRSAAGAGVPFGLANEALDIYAAQHPGSPTRHEDHVGHKIEWQNGVQLQRIVNGRRKNIGVTCDWLTKVHQGTHSADAFGNDVHELLYAVHCSDGTQIVADLLARFGPVNRFTRSCDNATPVDPGTTHTLPGGEAGARLIPDRPCVEQYLLVGDGAFSDFSRGLYEDWISGNHLRTADGRDLAYFDPHFAVFNPARYYDPSQAGQLGRTITSCFEHEANGNRAHGGVCDEIGAATTPIAWDEPASPFNGSHRETYFNQTTIDNPGGPTRWYTDPYGQNGSTAPFPGAVCQLIGAVDNRSRPRLESQAFGAQRPYEGNGVHAPN
jgi:hypothetical protein